MILGTKCESHGQIARVFSIAWIRPNCAAWRQGTTRRSRPDICWTDVAPKLFGASCDRQPLNSAAQHLLAHCCLTKRFFPFVENWLHASRTSRQANCWSKRRWQRNLLNPWPCGPAKLDWSAGSRARSRRATREAYRRVVRTLAADAAALLREWETEIEAMLGDSGQMEIMRDWGAKLTGDGGLTIDAPQAALAPDLLGRLKTPWWRCWGQSLTAKTDKTGHP